MSDTQTTAAPVAAAERGLGYLAPPGHAYGPCGWRCGHMECRHQRRVAESVCRLCQNLIGYEVRFAADPNHERRWVHRRCLARAEVVNAMPCPARKPEGLK